MNLDAELLLIIDECSGSLQVGVVKHIEELEKSGECALALEGRRTRTGQAAVGLGDDVC